MQKIPFVVDISGPKRQGNKLKLIFGNYFQCKELKL